MFRKSLSMVLVAVVVGLLGALSVSLVAVAQGGASAERSFSSASVAQEGRVTVMITATGYGLAGGVTETLPAGFIYVESSLPESQVAETGQDVRFTLQGETSFTYIVTASRTPASYTFSGTLRDIDRQDHTVGGASSVTVEAAQGGASAERSFSSASVAQEGRVTVTITATGYGLAGGVTETLPAGFIYVESSLPESQVAETGQDVRFTLQGETSFTYIVTASRTPASYTFSGTLRDIDRQDHTVGGASSVTVEAAQGGASAERSFSSASVAREGRVTVTITATGYGLAGGVTETLPAGFIYVESSLPESQVAETGQDVRFTLQGETSFTYIVTASRTPASYTFSGTLRDIDRQDHTVGGASSVTVEAAQGGASAERSFSSASVAQEGRVTVTITATGYGLAGGVTETLPAGFIYVESSLPESQVAETGQDVRFTLQGETSFTYIVTASRTPASYTFSGTLRDIDRQDHTVGGASSVTVEAAQGGASAERSFSSASVAQEGRVTVTITATGYGLAGGVTETLPAGFIYVESSLPESQVAETGQDVRFTLQGETSFTYIVTASRTPASYIFSGTLRDIDRQDHTVGGASTVTVEGPTARRSFSSASVAREGRVTVTITATGYGLAGGVTETLPAGFIYVESSLPESQVAETGQDVRFTLQGETSFTYIVTASRTPASYTFSGTLRDIDRQDHTVGGASSVTVAARRPSSGGGGGGGQQDDPTATPTPAPTATPTPAPTATPTPAPTATPTPAPTATPTPAPTATPTPAPTAMPTPAPTATPTPAPTATPTTAPAPTPTPAPTATPTTAPAPTPTPAPTATPTTAPAPTPTPAPTATPTTATPTTAPAPTPTPAPTATPEEEGGGFPGWVIVVIVLAVGALLIVGVGFLRSRRR